MVATTTVSPSRVVHRLRMTSRHTVVADDGLRDRIRAAIEKHGECLVAAWIRVGSPTLGRALAGLPVRGHTLSRIERGLARIEAAAP